MITNCCFTFKKLVNMNKYKFLKSISDGQDHDTDDPSLDNPKNQFLMKLKKEGLVKFQLVVLNNGNPGIVFYSITGKGLECR